MYLIDQKKSAVIIFRLSEEFWIWRETIN